MCGSVIGLLTLNLPMAVKISRRKMLPYILNYNLGRLLSYGIAGAIVGLLSLPLTSINGHVILHHLSVIVTIAMGIYLAGYFPKFAQVELIGAPIWNKLQPIRQRLLPVRNLLQAFLLGMVWGWLPCGLVYAALAVAATISEPIKSSMVMLAFGIGTLPSMIATGLFAGSLAFIARAKPLRQLAGISIIVIVLVTQFWPVDHGSSYNHSYNQEHPMS